MISCDNSPQTQNSSFEESNIKKKSQETQFPGEKALVDLGKEKDIDEVMAIQGLSSKEMEDRVLGSTISTDTVNAIVIPKVSIKETPLSEGFNEGETGSVSRFPENFREYEPEDITEYPDKTPKDPSQDPEIPVTSTDQK